jgi:hypothetical protein
LRSRIEGTLDLNKIGVQVQGANNAKEVLATYCAGATTVVVVVDAGTGAGVTVVVRLTVVVVSVGGGVLTTSSLAHAPRQAASPIMSIRRDNVFIFS